MFPTEPDELKDLVTQIRILERSMGNGVKTMRECEMFTHNKVSVKGLCERLICSHTIR